MVVGHMNDAYTSDEKSQRDSLQLPRANSTAISIVEIQPKYKSNSSAVVTQQPVILKKSTWASGLCACGLEPKNCFLTCFCYPCVTCDISRRMKENPCVPWLPGGLMALVTKFRTKHGIQGSICCDFLTSCFCASCVSCRLTREMNYYHYRVGDWVPVKE